VWTASVVHIRATPGFAGRRWPSEHVTPAENEADLRRHEADHEERTAFDVDVRSWVRQDLAHLDRPLHDAVRGWPADCWPWRAPDYAAR
jgi:hypothetical protein